MPKYRRGRGKLVKTHRNFEHPYQLIHFLSSTREKEYKPFRDIAKQYLDGSIVPGHKIRKNALQHLAYNDPKKLVPHVVHELDHKIGGGIVSGAASIVHEASHLLGLDLLSDAIFGVQPQQPQSPESEFASYLVAMTYKPISERPKSVLGKFTRLIQYDKDNVSVWRNNETNELTVSCRGTKMNFSDIGADIALFFGKTDMKDDNLDTVLNSVERDYPGQKYSISGHSLGSAYIWGEENDHSANWDNVYLFNAPSSPLQADSVVESQANDSQYQYFLNHGDVASANLTYFMDQDTLENNVHFGEYQYGPISAHSIHRWYPEEFALEDAKLAIKANQPKTYEGLEDLQPDSAMNQDTEETREAGLS
jgi:hypothetical protein